MSENKSEISCLSRFSLASVEGGFGKQYKVQAGPVDAKAGVAVKGVVEVSQNGVKVSAVAEVGANIGPVKSPGIQIVGVTRNEKGESEEPTVKTVKPGIKIGGAGVSGWKDEIKIGFSVYNGGGGGFSVTIRPTELENSVVNWLTANPGPSVDFNTNQHGIGAWQ